MLPDAFLCGASQITKQQQHNETKQWFVTGDGSRDSVGRRTHNIMTFPTSTSKLDFRSCVVDDNVPAIVVSSAAHASCVSASLPCNLPDSLLTASFQGSFCW
jgi:hypothetical protein